MTERVVLDGNEAVAHVAYQSSEVIAIYPITPSSAMGEWADQWASEGRVNAWGTVPHVEEMQSEGGAAGAVHGALQAGSLTTTFTASQGLLLMIPNLYKIAGELTPCVIHVAARSIATQGLSIFGDHSDVMAARATGWAMLASSSVQEAADLAVVAHAVTLKARLPFLHFFDGFRTSHEVNKVDLPGPGTVRAMTEDPLVRSHRGRALSPDHPVLRGTAQNPDVAFQARESVGPYYLACPELVQKAMDRFAALTGRQYHLFDYHGAADADRVLVLMGSGAGAAEETVEALCAAGEKVGLVKVRLFRPFSAEHLAAAIPATARTVVVLDRTKEPGGVGEPLYLDVVAALTEASDVRRQVVGGRFGLSSKEFTPGMVKAVFDHAKSEHPRNHFTVGIHDDVTHTSLDYDPDFCVEPADVVRAVFYGLGADGTVGANKNSIKIIGEGTPLEVQGYFVYDSKKSGSMTVSHLRFGPRPVRSTYLIQRATFVGCHQFGFLDRIDVLASAAPGATFLLNSPYGPDEVWAHLPRPVQEDVIAKGLRLWVTDAAEVARGAGMGGRINTVMQACFFALAGVLPRDEAVAAIKAAIAKSYGKRGQAVVDKNHAAVDAALGRLFEVKVPAEATATTPRHPAVPAGAPDFVKRVTALMMVGDGDRLPVSALPADGTWPTGTSKWEKRAIAQELPVWDEATCIQCGKCVLVCPHAAVRAQVYGPAALAAAPAAFKSAAARWPDRKHERFTLQVAPDDCTGCRLCVEVCPVEDKAAPDVRAINMRPAAPLREEEGANWEFFLKLPGADREHLRRTSVKDVQLLEPLFEFSGACAGCGETPYLKLLTQLFGDRMLVANATGCSSIFGGNLPTTPWSKNAEGRGPAWSNSLFEDNAEFGLGMRLSLDKQGAYARELVTRLAPALGAELAKAICDADQSTEAGIEAQRARVGEMGRKLAAFDTAEGRDLAAVAGALVRKSVWIVGGDGWAYDIGFGGVDLVLSSGANVKLLVLDTEVYSNTGGQMSKATPRGAVAKFAAAGKHAAKKDLALMAMTRGGVYVARVAMGASDSQTLTALREAEEYDGPALVIAYSHCIAHGYELCHGLDQQKAAVQSGHWPLLRYDPRRARAGANPLHLDSKPPSIPLEQYAYQEGRYTMLKEGHPEEARRRMDQAAKDVRERWNLYQHLAGISVARPADGAE
ncbi:MAG: pyruvate:ferredoxin (flavodoxin) oxidoreductase [Gemmataceae bacterium]